MRLFVKCAQAVQPGFVLSAQNAAAVVTVCRQLDGLPLAIELAAARLHVLPVAELLTRLDDRFRLRRRGGRGAADRHQTLQATLDWSYGLLDLAEQALLRQLAVFAGGWEMAAAEAVCAGEVVAVEAVLELLDELLERSLVYMHAAQGAPRYGLLETMRQYGLQHLERAGEATAVRDRHLRWCVALAEQAAPVPPAARPCCGAAAPTPRPPAGGHGPAPQHYGDGGPVRPPAAPCGPPGSASAATRGGRWAARTSPRLVGGRGGDTRAARRAARRACHRALRPGRAGPGRPRAPRAPGRPRRPHRT